MGYKNLQMRRDTAANWTSNNPTLLSGEMGYETDTGKFKIGDGSTAWISLNYAGGNGAFTSRCSVYRTEVQSIPHDGHYVIQFNNELFDGDDEFNLGTYKFTVKETGYYDICLQGDIQLPAACLAIVGVWVNDVSHIYGMEASFALGDNEPRLSKLLYLEENDYVDFTIYQNSGSSQNLYYLAKYTFATIHRIS